MHSGLLMKHASSLKLVRSSEFRTQQTRKENRTEHPQEISFREEFWSIKTKQNNFCCSRWPNSENCPRIQWQIFARGFIYKSVSRPTTNFVLFEWKHWTFGGASLFTDNNWPLTFIFTPKQWTDLVKWKLVEYKTLKTSYYKSNIRVLLARTLR